MNSSRLSQTKIRTTAALAVAPERSQHERRSHVADVGIGSGDALHHGLGQFAGVPPAGRERQDEGQERAGRGGGDEGPIRQLVQRLAGDQPVEEAGQRHVDQEELHPGEAPFRLPHELATEEAECDQAEEGSEEVEESDQVGHQGSIMACELPFAKNSRLRQCPKNLGRQPPAATGPGSVNSGVSSWRAFGYRAEFLI